MRKSKSLIALIMAGILTIGINPSVIHAQQGVVQSAKVKSKDTFDSTIVFSEKIQINVGIGHSPLVEGDTESFYITTNADINLFEVKYRVFLYDDTRKTRNELTKGYTELVNPNVPYEIKAPNKFKIGKYRVEVWVKVDGTPDEYDSKYIAYLNCVAKDNKNRVYANGDMLIEKDTYQLGEKVVINGIKNIGGITGPYKYRLHYYNNSKGWVKNVTQYADKIEWTPTEPGTYVLDVHINTPNSTTWKKYLANKNSQNLYGTYEAWKLKTITVVDKNEVPKKSIDSSLNELESLLANRNEDKLMDSIPQMETIYNKAYNEFKTLNISDKKLDRRFEVDKWMIDTAKNTKEGIALYGFKPDAGIADNYELVRSSYHRYNDPYVFADKYANEKKGKNPFLDKKLFSYAYANTFELLNKNVIITEIDDNNMRSLNLLPTSFNKLLIKQVYELIRTTINDGNSKIQTYVGAVSTAYYKQGTETSVVKISALLNGDMGNPVYEYDFAEKAPLPVSFVGYKEGATINLSVNALCKDELIKSAWTELTDTERRQKYLKENLDTAKLNRLKDSLKAVFGQYANDIYDWILCHHGTSVLDKKYISEEKNFGKIKAYLSTDSQNVKISFFIEGVGR